MIGRAVIAVCVLAVSPVSALADEAVAKKDAYLADKIGGDADPAATAAWNKALDARVGQAPATLVNLYTQWHKEFLPVEAGATLDVPEELVNYFFRCHFTGEPTEMDPRLLGVLVGAAVHFESPRVNVVSGFRAPKYNLVLQKKGREVSRESQHTMGRAVDFRIPGVPIERVHRWVRSLRLGGVGFYTHSKFIHADTWKVRYWTGR